MVRMIEETVRRIDERDLRQVSLAIIIVLQFL